MLPKLLVYT